jgi:hypothetical protein
VLWEYDNIDLDATLRRTDLLSFTALELASRTAPALLDILLASYTDPQRKHFRPIATSIFQSLD